MLLSYLGDKMTQCEKEEAVAYSYFLDSRQRMIAEKFCSSKWQGHYLFWGGYEDSERAVCFFLPWYLQREQFMEQPEEYAPLALLRVQNKSGAVLSHRDYLGALMALGIKRELVGDILVFQQGCDIIVFDKIAFYVKTNYEKAGNAGLAVKEVPIAQICREEQRRERLQLTAASLRLDVLVSAIFHLSRAGAAECRQRESGNNGNWRQNQKR